MSEETNVAEPTIEEPTVEITEQAFQESFQENFTAVLEEEGLTETFEQALDTLKTIPRYYENRQGE